MATTYHVSLPAFEGPFDLLLHLIARRKVDIYDISLAEITDDYLAVVHEMEILDLDVATEFLVVAATLIELKAARLLPGEDDPELDEVAVEARDLLYARLLDYRMFKEAAAAFAERFDAHHRYVPRAVPLEERYRRCLPQVELPVDAQGLATLAARALAERPVPAVDLSHVQPVRLTVREAAGMVMDELDRAGGRASFRELAAGCRHRIEVIIHFLALLELYKLECIDLEQTASFAELVVQRIRPDANLAGAVLELYEERTSPSTPTRPPVDEQVPNP
jgi:segregation and condensation protein A